MNKFYLKTLCLCLFFFTGISASAYDCVVNGIYYNLDNGYHAAYVTYKNYKSTLNEDAYKGIVNIPSSFYYNGVWYDVHVIEAYAFYNCSGVTSVTIPDGVVNINDYAFSKCSNLSSITMPNSLRRIGEYAFEGCNGLTSITIPKSVYSIGKCPLVNCSNLESIIVEKGNSYYDTSEGCNAIISIDDGTLIAGCKNTNIPNNVKYIGEGAFQGCTGLTSINIPNGVRHIRDNAFSRCTGLISVTNPSIIIGVTLSDYNYFGYGAFANCSSLTSINIPSNVDYIPQFTFEYCSALTSIAIPSSVKRIGRGAFNGCTCTVTYNNKTPANADPESFVYYTNTTSMILFVPKESIDDYKRATGWGRLQIKALNDLDGTTTSTSVTTNLSDSSIINYATFEGQIYYPQDNTIKLIGLDPGKDYVTTIHMETDEGLQIEQEHLFRTADLSLATSQPKVVSLGNVIVSADTNLDDEETNVGFEWRRTDWTDDFDSNKGEAYLYDGMMEGYIRNLNTEKLWKYRPYYLSNSGTYYYGEWVGLDPTNTSYFEPTVHTYASVNVNGNTASVKGYAMTGTDKITSQGFKFWKGETAEAKSMDAPQKAASIPSDAMTIEADGQVMTANLTGLDYNSTYHYLAFVTTSEGETFYGEEQMFETGDDPTGIEGIETEPTEQKPVTIVARYNMNGQQISAPQRGINILRMSDGTVKKVLVK